MEIEKKLELENRMKNLLWTVSGDYTLDPKLQVEDFDAMKYHTIYEAIKQGALAKYYDQDAYSLYLLKKIFLGGDQGSLMKVSSLCIDVACSQRIMQERKGVYEIRKKAYEEVLEENFEQMLTEGLLGKIKFALLKAGLRKDYRSEKKVTEALELLWQLEKNGNTEKLIRVTDEFYNRYADIAFEQKHGNLEKVLSVTIEELEEFGWQEYLEELTKEDLLEQMKKRMADAVTNLDDRKPEKKKSGASVILLDQKAVEKMYSYIESNYGKSYLTQLEQKQYNYRNCYGVHGGCQLYFTDGILKNPVAKTNNYVIAARARELNLTAYRQHQNAALRNIEILEMILKRSLNIRNQQELVPAQYGILKPERLWKIGRVEEYQVFDRKMKRPQGDFAVELLMDASGSQQKRQHMVALQGFIVSRALSKAGIPHRVRSFCTFWDYTVLQRYRDFDDPMESDWNLFDFRASSNNRDGLAIRAAAEGLLKRQEENKILIVLSDGKPNDMNQNRQGAAVRKELYTGEYAVCDTAMEVRKARAQGISVLGVFMGEEEDLLAERRIFGRDFAYIKHISNFSNVVGCYLQKQLEEI